MADRLTDLAKQGARLVRSQPVLQRGVHSVTEVVRSQPVLVDALSRLAALEGDERILPLATPPAAVEARRAAFPEDPGPERWPVVGVETHHLGAEEEQALAAVARQQLAEPWFRPVFLASEAAAAAARATGCPFDLVPAHATGPEVLGQRVADLLTGFGATSVLRADAAGLAPEHLLALRTVAARQRVAREARAARSRGFLRLRTPGR
ncbi:hypothetical protein [Kytococcus schroeteri]|uniref:hypothetical protein n=1 Tax=Kytococcus schroeteri TaxID=138300 RepID=UPI001141A375|nr:hypothetical protein [Kytococcus schroeteri]